MTKSSYTMVNLTKLRFSVVVFGIILAAALITLFLALLTSSGLSQPLFYMGFGSIPLAIACFLFSVRVYRREASKESNS